MEFESYEDWISKLKEVSQSPDTIILVEGKRDREKLDHLGIKNVIDLKGRRYYDVLEDIADHYHNVILLFDLDKHGERIFQKFKYMLEKEGIKTNSEFREYLKNLNIEEIEDLPEVNYGTDRREL
jgi:5S rRNA maturation endonuclease (ribonuclease M5)